MGQIVVTGGAVAPLFRVPAGLANVTFWNNTPAATIYVGSSTTVTAANGLVCHSIPTSFFNYVSSAGAQFYGTVAAGPGTISYIIVSGQLWLLLPGALPSPPILPSRYSLFPRVILT
jgi:hypothetical protein